MMKRWQLLFLVFMLLVLPMQAQENGGVITEYMNRSALEIGPLNPLRCNTAWCERITDLLFPTLFAIDPATQLVTDGDAGNYGLAVDVSADVGDVYRVNLREDAFWSDGTPITAYDVFYSYLAVVSNAISSPLSSYYQDDVPFMQVIDAHRLDLYFSQPNCESLANANLPIVPYHVFDPVFADVVSDFNAEGTSEEQYKAWIERYPEANFQVMIEHRFDRYPDVSWGPFVLDEPVSLDDIHLRTPDNRLAYVFREPDSIYSEVDLFRQGASDILINPPLDEVEMLAALPDVQMVTYPALAWDYIAFNLADPSEPSSAFDRDGDPIEQGQHPYFNDVRLRYAVQLAINVQELIDVGLYGYATPMSAQILPQSWANDATLDPIGYDPAAARRLLDEAGWRDSGQNGSLNCVRCDTARPDTILDVGLMYANNTRMERIARLVARQLEEVGFQVSIWGGSFNEAQQQNFDLYLGSWYHDFPYDPDVSILFERGEDIYGDGFNIGSYVNDAVEQRMADAESVPGCDIAQRASIYGDIERLLQDDPPYVWLYAQNDVVLVRNDVIGFAPYVNAPFWNLESWQVVR
ncbi:MAG: hypothetical protein H6670_16740 [Anaerolineaceae bacterium]|nr:hypothetical protein [Anaerolineaceae bacterium]